MRWKNYGLWVAIIALIPLVADALEAYNINVILPGNYDILAKAILSILILAGILNSPTTKNKGFLDD